ncbi:hypothetical protein PYCC9005_003347 [Savitreella phatthalungensis]
MPPGSRSSESDKTSNGESTDSPLSKLILKRAEIGKITRALKDRLEIAQHKISRSWQNLPLNAVESRMAREAEDAARKSERESSASTSAPGSITSDPAGARQRPLSRDRDFLVPDLPVRARPHNHNEPTIHVPAPNRPVMSQSIARAAAAANGSSASGHPSHRISPLKRYRSDSLEADSPELGSSPLKYHASATSNGHGHGVGHGHPIARHMTPPLAPSTPPPLSAGRGLPHTRSHSSFKPDTEEGADLLLFLATSPSPARPKRTSARALEAFSSPPPMRGSSQVNTPIGQAFNLSEFLNFTPSPSQAIAHANALTNPHHPGSALRGGRPDTSGHTGTAFKVSPTKLTYDFMPSPSRPAQKLDFGDGPSAA